MNFQHFHHVIHAAVAQIAIFHTTKKMILTFAEGGGGNGATMASIALTSL